MKLKNWFKSIPTHMLLKISLEHTVEPPVGDHPLCKKKWSPMGVGLSWEDYEGQKLAERLFHIVILFFGAVGFLWGYYIQQFGATMIILAAGFIVSCLLVLPPWPMYRKNPLDWQKPRQEKVDTKREGGKKKQK